MGEASGRQLSGFKLREEMRHSGVLGISYNDRLKVCEQGRLNQFTYITAEGMQAAVVWLVCTGTVQIIQTQVEG